MIVKGIKGGDLAMPFRQVFAAFEIDLVVRPHAGQARCDVEDSWRLLADAVDFPAPVGDRIVPFFLVNPVAVHDAEEDFLGNLLVEHGAKRGEPRAIALHSLIVATADLEAEIEQPPGLCFSCLNSAGSGKVRNEPP